MDWISALGQALATVTSAVVIYVLGQLLVKLADPALALRGLIGQIAGDLLLYANRDERIATNQERLKIFRQHASDLYKLNSTVIGYGLFFFFRRITAQERRRERGKTADQLF